MYAWLFSSTYYQTVAPLTHSSLIPRPFPDFITGSGLGTRLITLHSSSCIGAVTGASLVPRPYSRFFRKGSGHETTVVLL